MKNIKLTKSAKQKFINIVDNLDTNGIIHYLNKVITGGDELEDLKDKNIWIYIKLQDLKSRETCLVYIYRDKVFVFDHIDDILWCVNVLKLHS